MEITDSKKKNIIRILTLSTWLCMMVLIFWFSSKPANISTLQSHAVDEAIIKIVIRNFKDFTETVKQHYIEMIDHFIRKSAHFAEYAVLGVLTWLAINISILPFIFEKPNKANDTDLLSKDSKFTGKFNKEATIEISKKQTKKYYILKNIIIPVLWCLLYSISDEIHQYFVEGRYASPLDVLIDTTGAICGILILLLIKRFHDKASATKSKASI